MNNGICRECETVAHCAARGCIPVTEYEPEEKPDTAAKWMVIAVVITALAAAAASVVVR